MLSGTSGNLEGGSDVPDLTNVCVLGGAAKNNRGNYIATGVIKNIH